MSIVLKLSLILRVLLTPSYDCVAASEISDGPKLVRANGTRLKENEEMYILYGKSLELFCTGHAEDLIIVKDDQELPTTFVNKTAIRLFFERPEEGYYYCKDTKTKNRVYFYVKEVYDSEHSNGPKLVRENGTVLKERELIFILPRASLELYCTGQNQNLKIFNDYKEIPTTVINKTTIRFLVEIITSEGLVYCQDTKTNKFAIIYVDGVHYPEYLKDIPKFLKANGTVLRDKEVIGILYGASLELFCTGHAEDLIILNDDQEIPTTAVNKSAIRLFVERPEQGYTYYHCYDTNNIMSAQVKVFVGVLPEIRDFRCISYKLMNLNCTWKSLLQPKYSRELYSLYYVKDGIPTVLCKSWFQFVTTYCVWSRTHPTLPFDPPNEPVKLLIESCNVVGCNNQTFEIDLFAVVKTPPPKTLYLLSKSSHNAMLGIELHRGHSYDFKINYWYSGNYPRRVNSSASLVDTDWYKVEVELPCAETYYDVKVSVKLSSAIGEEFWSDEKDISFMTDPEPEKVDAVVDPTCIRPRVPITPEIMLYEMEKFRDEFTKEQNELKKRIKSLKSKVV